MQSKDKQKPLGLTSKRFLCYISNIPIELSQIHRECKTPQWGVFGLYHQLINRFFSVIKKHINTFTRVYVISRNAVTMSGIVRYIYS